MKVKILSALFIALIVVVAPVSCGYFNTLYPSKRTKLFEALSQDIPENVTALEDNLNGILKNKFIYSGFITTRFWYNVFTFHNVIVGECPCEDTIYAQNIVMRLLMLMSLNGIFSSKSANHALIKAQLGPSKQIGKLESNEVVNPTATVLSDKLNTYFVFSKIEAGVKSAYEMLKESKTPQNPNFEIVKKSNTEQKTFLDLFTMNNHNAVIDTNSEIGNEYYKSPNDRKSFLNRETISGILVKNESDEITKSQDIFDIELNSGLNNIIALASSKVKKEDKNTLDNLKDVFSAKLNIVRIPKQEDRDISGYKENYINKFMYNSGIHPCEDIALKNYHDDFKKFTGEESLAVQVEQDEKMLRLIFEISEEITKVLRKKEDKNELHEMKQSLFYLLLADSNEIRRKFALELIDKYIIYANQLPNDERNKVEHLFEKVTEFKTEINKTEQQVQTPNLPFLCHLFVPLSILT